jgi:hypothetical protein
MASPVNEVAHRTSRDERETPTRLHRAGSAGTCRRALGRLPRTRLHEGPRTRGSRQAARSREPQTRPVTGRAQSTTTLRVARTRQQRCESLAHVNNVASRSHTSSSGRRRQRTAISIDICRACQRASASVATIASAPAGSMTARSYVKVVTSAAVVAPASTTATDASTPTRCPRATIARTLLRHHRSNQDHTRSAHDPRIECGITKQIERSA